MSIWTDLLGAQVRYLGDKYRTRVIEAGEGPALVLLHGNGGHAEAYSRNIMRLAQSFHVMALDLVWHGYSQPVPFNPAMVPTYAEQVLEVTAANGVERFSIEGESLGGWVALWLALHQRERVQGIVLNTPAGVNLTTTPEARAEANTGFRERSLAALREPTPETIRRRLEFLMASPDRVTEELVETRCRIYSMPQRREALIEVTENSFGAGSGRDYVIGLDQLRQITVPTLVLWTEKNPGVGPEGGRQLADAIPGAEYYCVMDAGHWPQWEKPEEHDRVVLEFLKGALT